MAQLLKYQDYLQYQAMHDQNFYSFLLRYFVFLAIYFTLYFFCWYISIHFKKYEVLTNKKKRAYARHRV